MLRSTHCSNISGKPGMLTVDAQNRSAFPPTPALSMNTGRCSTPSRRHRAAQSSPIRCPPRWQSAPRQPKPLLFWLSPVPRRALAARCPRSEDIGDHQSGTNRPAVLFRAPFGALLLAPVDGDCRMSFSEVSLRLIPGEEKRQAERDRRIGPQQFEDSAVARREIVPSGIASPLQAMMPTFVASALIGLTSSAVARSDLFTRHRLCDLACDDPPLLGQLGCVTRLRAPVVFERLRHLDRLGHLVRRPSPRSSPHRLLRTRQS